jgi:hypothetical protein
MFITPRTRNIRTHSWASVWRDQKPQKQKNRISCEMIKVGGQRLWKEIYELIQIICNTVDRTTAIICPIKKNGSKLICNNSRVFIVQAY